MFCEVDEEWCGVNGIRFLVKLILLIIGWLCIILEIRLIGLIKIRILFDLIM